MATADTSKQIDAARFAAFLNGSYHADREGVLDRRHRWMMFLVVALGAWSIVSAFGDGVTLYLGMATALLGAIDLTFNFSIRARNHAYLRKEYFRIAADLVSEKCSPKDAEERMMELAGEEDPPYMAAHSLAANWAMKAVYGSNASQPCRVNRWQRLARHWFRMTDVDFSRDK